MNAYQTIIKREFEAASGLSVTQVVFTEDEEIIVTANGKTYMMSIGSDDDLFILTDDDGHAVTFDYPADFLALEADGTTSWDVEADT